jgi:hypothetical protein
VRAVTAMGRPAAPCGVSVRASVPAVATALAEACPQDDLPDSAPGRQRHARRGEHPIAAVRRLGSNQKSQAFHPYPNTTASDESCAFFALRHSPDPGSAPYAKNVKAADRLVARLRLDDGRDSGQARRGGMNPEHFAPSHALFGGTLRVVKPESSIPGPHRVTREAAPRSVCAGPAVMPRACAPAFGS